MAIDPEKAAGLLESELKKAEAGQPIPETASPPTSGVVKYDLEPILACYRESGLLDEPGIEAEIEGRYRRALFARAESARAEFERRTGGPVALTVSITREGAVLHCKADYKKG